MTVIKLEDDIYTNLRNLILYAEKVMFRNKYYKFGTILNMRRVSKYTREVRKAAKFDLLYHLKHRDLSGRTEGCGCPYCVIHHKYVKYRNIYLNVRRRYDKLLAVLERPELAYKREVLPMSLNPKVLAGYKEALTINREEYLKQRALRKRVSKLFKIPI